METFSDFYPDTDGSIRKKIILKVSDYRSALIQGTFLAKKGLWVSEFRLESGLNCGGHAFATEGFLMGPILEEFRQRRDELYQTLYKMLCEALQHKKRPVPLTLPGMKLTAQGGVGTAGEHTFLIEHYQLDAVGWGSPFLLVPEVTCVDHPTRLKLKHAKENDLYLSKISPLGVPFHNLKNNSKDAEKEQLIQKGKPGSPCLKKLLAFNTDYTKKPICTASSKYQRIKLKELEGLNLSPAGYRIMRKNITEKACICTGLGTPFLLENGLETHQEGAGVSVCPGPNIAYFDKVVSLKEMVDHIYGRNNLISRKDRPHMFIKELGLYLNHLKELTNELLPSNGEKALKRIHTFIHNLRKGIVYYQEILHSVLKLPTEQSKIFSEFLEDARLKIDHIEHHLSSKISMA